LLIGVGRDLDFLGMAFLYILNYVSFAN